MPESPVKNSTTLNAQEGVILFCTATGISHADVGITAHAMQSMAVKGFIVHDHETGAYALTDSGCATLTAMLEDAGLKAGMPKPTSIDAWVADLMKKPEKKRAESLYELLLHLNLSMSHLEDEHETYARRLGLR